MSITKEMADKWTEVFLANLQDEKFYQKDAAIEYACLLFAGPLSAFDWPKINKAIINKWSDSGLVRVKEAAWKILG